MLFLGRVVLNEEIETYPDNILKVKNWPAPKNADELWSCFAFADYAFSM